MVKILKLTCTFDKLIRFCEVKPNTKIIVKLLKKTAESKKIFQSYKKMFEEARYSGKLNMDLKLYEVEKSSTESINTPLSHLTLRE